MSLTVKEILEKTFKRSFKGYDEDEVDKFLDQIIDEIKALQSENESLIKEQKSLKEQANKVKSTEETIMHTLVSAQKSAERVMNEAARKAELILESAESTAKQKKEQTAKELAETEQKLKTLRASAKSFAASFANMINSQAADFEKNYKSNFGDTDVFPDEVINSDIVLEQEPKEQPDKSFEENANIKPEEKPELQIFAKQDNEPEAQMISEIPTALPPEEDTEAQAADEQPVSQRGGLMELHEINQALSDLEKDGDILQDSYEQDTKEPEETQPEEIGFEETEPEETQPEETKENKAEEPGEKKEKIKPEAASYKQKYDDYSWLYENDDNQKEDDFELSFKNEKEKEELKSLIDEIID